MKGWFFILFFGAYHLVVGQNKAILDYIEKYKTIAQTEMERTKIPASITLAQGIHESNWGKSELAVNTNNHFGIKCHKDWNGPEYYYDDDRPQECFRVYKKAEDSYLDHSNFLLGRKWYAPLFQLDIQDYKGWARGLKAAGYATNPKYPEILIQLIETYQLFLLDGDSSTPHDAIAHDAEPKIENQYLDKIKINGLMALIYDGKYSLNRIAEENNVSTAQINLWNDIHGSRSFKEGDYVFLQPKKEQSDDYGQYEYSENESIWDIAQKFGINEQALLKNNQITAQSRIKDGEIIVLNGKREFPIHLLNREAEKEIKVDAKKHHIVKSKETLYSIAKSHQLTIAELKKMNKLLTDTLYIGQRLRVAN